MKAYDPRRGNLSPARLTGCALALMLMLVLIASPRDTGWTASSAARAAAGAGVARAQSSVKGQFGPLMSWGAQPVMVHASVLPDGRVLFWGRDKVTSGGGGLTKLDVVGRSMARVWNPSNNTFETVDNFTTNLFCSGHSLLPDGRLFAAGGHAHPHQYSRSGDAHTNVFDPVTRQWSNGPNMEKGRWYPFTLALDTGEVAIVAGTYQTGPAPNPDAAPPVAKQQKPELYNPKTNTLELLNVPDTNGEELPNYPYLFLDPVGGGTRGVFVAGPRYSIFWNPRGGADGKGAWSERSLHLEKHIDGSAVMYDSEQGKILLTGGRLSDSGNTFNVAKTITLNQPNPQWQAALPMHHKRTFHNSTLLPDGKVLVTGGVPCRGGHTLEPCYGDNGVGTVDINATRTAEMWDPATGAWSLMATGAVTRTYHSTALLLPDARVLVGGGGMPDGWRSSLDGADSDSLRRHNAGERNVELYSPPYLFDANGNPAPRPSISAVAADISYGQQFALTYNNAASISRVAWVRLPSATHGFNTDQRINVLQYSATPGVANQLTVTAPADPRKCPPGHYMLFVFNQNGTPSVAKIIKVRQGQNSEDFVGRRSISHNGRVHVFYRHLGDRTLRYMSQTTPDAKTFTAPFDLGGLINSNPLAIHNADGRLEVIAVGADSAGLYSNRQTAVGSNTWLGWQPIGGPTNLTVIALAKNLDGRLQVFYRGTDNALWYIAQTAPNSTTWTAAVTLGGGITSEPAVGMNADGRLEVFVRGLDNALYHNWQTTPGSGTWSGFYRLGGVMTSGPFVAANADGRLDVFVRGTDNGAHHIKQVAPGSSQNWSAFEALGGSLNGDHPFNSPAAALTPDGRLQLFVRWQDGTLRTMVQNAPNGGFTYNAWANLWGWIDATVPPPTRSNDGRFFIFVRGGGFNLYFNTQTTPNNYVLWDGFAYLGDGAHSF